MMAMLQCCVWAIVLTGYQIYTAECAVSFPVNPVVASIQKTATVNSAVVTVTATDTDGTTLDYSLESQDPDTSTKVFSIDGTSGAITVSGAAQLNYETTKGYKLLIKATQAGEASPKSGKTTVSVTVKDGNKAPTFLEALFTACVNKGSSEGTVALQVTASDEDSVDILAYSITAGNENAIFAVEASNGTITVASGKSVGEPPASYNLTLTATDNDQVPKTSTTTVSINVADPCPVVTPPPNFATTITASFCLFLVSSAVHLLCIW